MNGSEFKSSLGCCLSTFPGKKIENLSIHSSIVLRMAEDEELIDLDFDDDDDDFLFNPEELASLPSSSSSPSAASSAVRPPSEKSSPIPETPSPSIVTDASTATEASENGSQDSKKVTTAAVVAAAEPPPPSTPAPATVSSRPSKSSGKPTSGTRPPQPRVRGAWPQQQQQQQHQRAWRAPTGPPTVDAQQQKTLLRRFPRPSLPSPLTLPITGSPADDYLHGVRAPSRAVLLKHIQLQKISYRDLCFTANFHGGIEFIKIVPKQFAAVIRFMTGAQALSFFRTLQGVLASPLDTVGFGMQPEMAQSYQRLRRHCPQLRVAWGKSNHLDKDTVQEILRNRASRVLRIRGLPATVTEAELRGVRLVLSPSSVPSSLPFFLSFFFPFLWLDGITLTDPSFLSDVIWMV